MGNENLTERDVERIAELETRRYFDQYLRDVWPVHQAALREHTAAQVKAHDDSENAHGGVERRFNRMIWVVTGVATVSATGGAGLTRLVLDLMGS